MRFSFSLIEQNNKQNKLVLFVLLEKIKKKKSKRKKNMAKLNDCVAVFEQLKVEFNRRDSDTQKCGDLLAKLKVLLLNTSFFYLLYSYFFTRSFELPFVFFFFKYANRPNKIPLA